jgi:hypothetical protein
MGTGKETEGGHPCVILSSPAGPDLILASCNRDKEEAMLDRNGPALKLWGAEECVVVDMGQSLSAIEGCRRW